MEDSTVPVTMGSKRACTREVDGLLVTEARFSPDAVLERHRHERPILCVMMKGSFDHVGDRGGYDCTPGTLLIEPAEEPHGNRIKRTGAHVLVIQPEPRSDLSRALGGLLDRSAYLRLPGLVARARALTAELSARDDAAPLALEAGALEMLAVAARMKGLRRGDTPAWLVRAREAIEDRFRAPIRLSDLAREASVHPAHLSRVFRQRYREPIGACIRRLRTEWAAERLATTDDPISAIALAAGFADQSHLTRALRAATGMTPAVYRRERRR